MNLLSGRDTSAKIKEELAEKVEKLISEGKKRPHLAAVLVGEDGGSLTYVNAKVKACEKIGYKSTLVKLPDTVTQEHLLREINKLNENPDIDGFIVQLPLPDHIDEQVVIESVNPEKDVDGFHPSNVGKMVLNLPTFVSATPQGILELLKRNQVETEGKHCVVIGRSNIVGTPVSILLSRNTNPGNCTVTLAHSRTKNLSDLTRQADIVIVALGKPGFLKGDMVKDGVVVIDVGTTRIKDDSKKNGFRLQGDVNFEEVSPKSSFITPVPGGVGPMTIVSLLMNTLKAAEGKKELT
jgi:methylenetetrahydrofolate dehydrogenase (NADP+)/methenyltetrahydrofolate cyclohydrolase